MSRLTSAGPAATRGQCNQPLVIAPDGTSRCRRMNAVYGLMVSRACCSDGGVESDWMHGTARCFGYPSDSSPAARQHASWTLSAGDRPAYYDYAVDCRRHLRHHAWLPAAGRGATRAGSRDPARVGPSSPPPPLLVADAAGPGATRAGPRRPRRGSGVLTVCCSRRGSAGPVPRPLSRVPAGAACRSAGSPPHVAAGTRRQSPHVSWGCAAGADTAGCGSPGAPTAVRVRACRRAWAACHGCPTGPSAGAPESPP